ncbi:MAG: DoxX family protein [Cyanobacteriota bacterium]|nr:DoxX family protein [Cyanobacteriota bacterium]
MKYLPLTARIFIAIIFLNSGVGKILGFSGTQAMMSGKGLPAAGLLLVGTIAFQLLGGLSLVLGYKIKWGAILLILFLIPATLVFHSPLNPEEFTNFLKNLALIGGLLLLVERGAGPLSLDEQTDESLKPNHE